MKRKIIKQGHNTLTITLPSEWTKKFNLSSGDEIDLIEKENGLFVSTERLDDERKTEFDITDMDIPTIWKYFMAVYRDGYDELVVRFDPSMMLDHPYKFLTHHRLDLRFKQEREKKKVVRALQGFVDRFIGFEIVEHGKDFIKIKEMGDLTSKEFDNSLRRIFLLIEQMAEETLEAIEKSDPKNLIHLHDIDINLDKFHDYCIRILNKNVNKDTRKSSLLFSTLAFLELIGDEFKDISVHLLEDFKGSKFKRIHSLTKIVKEQLKVFEDLFYNFDREKIKEISELDKKGYFSFPSIYGKASDEEKEIFHHLRIIGRYMNALTELRIEMEF